MTLNSRTVHMKGVPASPGIGIGEAWIYEDKKITVRPEKIDESEINEHLQKFAGAIEQLKNEYEELKKIADDEAAEIIEAQIQTLKDPELHNLVHQKIEQTHYGVIYAIFSTFNEYIQLMEASGAAWLEERTIDIVTIRDQLIEASRDKKKEINVKEGAVVFASEISPTVMIELSRVKIAGIVMQKGGLTSHAVILSQSLGIPCVVGVKWKHLNISAGAEAALNGNSGEVIIWPAEREIKEFEELREMHSSRVKNQLEYAKKPHKTLCGSDFELRANVEFLEELPRIESHGAKGVGLLRTETILFEKTDFNVDDQVDFYSSVLDASGSDAVTIRLFDAGGDKLLEEGEAEANPFLGWRGIRLLLDKKELLNNQLEAILRISGKYPGRIKILVPMVSEIREIGLVKNQLAAVKEKLAKNRVHFDEAILFGIMVEVPAIALMAEQAGNQVDFFSIGTNDLTQYTLAVDRGNQRISNLFDPNNPAVWKLIRMTKEGADNCNIPVAVCGEMASNPGAAACLLGMGISDLSMTTNAIPAVKALLCKRSLREMEQLAEMVLKAESSEKINRLLKTFADEEKAA